MPHPLRLVSGGAPLLGISASFMEPLTSYFPLMRWQISAGELPIRNPDPNYRYFTRRCATGRSGEHVVAHG
jgi:hypothetical protein